MTIRTNPYDHRKLIFIQPGEHEPQRWFFDAAVPVIQRPGYPEWRRRYECITPTCQYAGGYLNTNLCEECAWKIWAAFTNADELPRAQTIQAQYDEWWAREEDRQTIREITVVDAPPAEGIKNIPGHIYYLLVGDLIKIGYTKNLEQRMRQYPPHSKLLAVHPGTMRTERQMHSMFFNSIAKGKEWFAITPKLTSHIEDVRRKFKTHTVSEDLDDLRNAA